MYKFTYPRFFFFVLLALGLHLPVQAVTPADDAIIELFQRVEGLEQELSALQGENDQLRYQLEELKKQSLQQINNVRKEQRDGFIDVDERMTELEGKITSSDSAAAPADDTAADKPADGTTDQPPANTDKPETTDKSAANDAADNAKLSDKDAYKEAYDLLKQDSKAALEKLASFLQNYDSSPLAANAQYWIGEAKYSMNDYHGASEEFLKVLKNYKNSTKAPDAALKLGYSFYAMKNWDYARKTLEDAIRFFPNSDSAKLAQARLDRMISEGH